MSETGQAAKAELEMRLDGPVPQGVLTSPEGRSFSFSGWTELAAAIEDWRAHAAGTESRRQGGGEPAPAERLP